MRQKFFQWALVCVLVLAGVSCDLPRGPDFGKGTLTLFLPETGEADPSRAVLADSFTGALSYRVSVSGPGETRTLELKGGGTTLTLDVGTWTVDVAAYDPANPAVQVGSGGAVIAVTAGQNVSARIPMTVDPAYEAGLTEIYIHTEAELRRMGTDFAIDGSIKFYLERDIVLTQPWKAVGGLANPFKAEFDGQGHTVTVRAFDGPVLDGFVYQGFFASVDGALIKNTTVRYELSGVVDIRTGDPATYQDAYAGGVAGKANNTVFENVRVTGNLSVIADGGSGLSVGGIVGNCDNTTITNCHVSGAIGGDSANYLPVGGIGGMLSGSAITGSSFTGNVKGRADGDCEAGGIAGLINAGTEASGCYAEGRIEGEGESGFAGGIAGYITNGGRVETCYAAGVIQGTGLGPTTFSSAFSGGIAGFSDSIIESCYARTYVETHIPSGDSSAGGIAGQLLAAGNISNSYALGTVKAGGVSPSNRDAGGIAGYFHGAPAVIYNNVALNQSIEAPAPYNHTGGIIGRENSPGIGSGSYAANDIVFVPSPQTATNPFLTGNNTLLRSAFAGPANQGRYVALGWTFGAGGSWKYVSGYDYPALSWQDRPPADPAAF
jgi:hypothetical protein